MRLLKKRNLVFLEMHGIIKQREKGARTTIRSHRTFFPAWFVAIAPALMALLATVVYGALFGGPHLSNGWPSIWKTLLRFFRFALVLHLPLYAIVPMYGFIVKKKKTVLLQMKEERDFTVHPLKHWVFRPFQGIGIGLLFSTKLLTVLQLIAGPTVRPSLLIPEGQFEFARFLMITAVTVFVSLLLSTLWTLDDMGIRYFNRKDQELKMIGKYAGTVVPTVFGLYGLLGLLADYPTDQAFAYASKIVVVLYPPLAIFTVAHTYSLRKKAGFLFKKSLLKRGGILEHD
jgi:hypothetical protein